MKKTSLGVLINLDLLVNKIFGLIQKKTEEFYLISTVCTVARVGNFKILNEYFKQTRNFFVN